MSERLQRAIDRFAALFPLPFRATLKSALTELIEALLEERHS